VVLLALGHGVLALIAFVMRDAEEVRARGVQVISLVGVTLGAILFFLRHSGLKWRTLDPDPGPTVAAGVACACTWLLVLSLDKGRGRWEPACLAGVGSCGLVLFALNAWAVPALLFWWTSSAALAAAARNSVGRSQFWLALAASDLLLTAGIALHALGEEIWALPGGLSGMSFWFVAAAALVRAGFLPRIGLWGASDFPLWPLLPGGAFAIAGGLTGREEPWLGLAVLLGALAIAVWFLVRPRSDLSFPASWPVALMLAVLFVVPGVPWQASAAGLIASTSVLLWPIATGRAQIERGLLISFLPPSAGFSAIVVAAVATFDQATATTDVLSAAPWTAVTALLPAALGAGVILAIRVSRRIEAEGYEPTAVLVTWGLFFVSIVAGLWPRFVSETDGGATSRVFVLHLVALGAGIAAARFVSRPAPEKVGEEVEPLVVAYAPLPALWDRTAQLAAASVGVGGAALALWVTYRGLQVGFL